MDELIYPVCVIGGGAAGTMAVLRCVLNNDDCLFFPGSPRDKKRSRAFWVRKIENMPAHLSYQKGIDGPNKETMDWIQQSPFASRLHLQKNTGVTEIKKINDLFHLTDSNGNKHLCRYVVLCTGVMDIQPEIGSSIEGIFEYANAQVADYCLMCDGHHVLGKKVVVIGHTTSAAWVAIILHERYQPESITLLTNGKPSELSDEVLGLFKHYKIDVNQQKILSMKGRDQGKFLERFELQEGQVCEASICFIALGMIVYNQLALQIGASVDERGFVIANENGESSVEGFYIAGDLKAGTKKQIYTSWDTAVNAANSVNLKLRKSHRPI